MDLFDELLKGLSALIGANLHRDDFNACCLQVGEKLSVHIAPDKQRHIVVFAFLEEIGPGKFREEILKEGLKANRLLLPGGVIGYSGKNHSLSLHQLLPETILPDELHECFLNFLEYATQWQTALSQGKTSPLTLIPQSTAPPPFGLRP